MRKLITIVGTTAFFISLGFSSLYAQQKSKLGLSPADQQKYDELIASAERSLMMGYIAAGAAVLFLIAYIVYALRRRVDKKPKQQQETDLTK